MERKRHKFKRLLAGAAIIFWVMLGASGQAMAQSDTAPVDVAVFELTGQGVEDDLRETLTSVLRQEARQHEAYALATPAAVRRDEVALLVGCESDQTACLRQMADYVEGQVLIVGTVERRGQALAITIDILDAHSTEEPVRVESLIDASRDPVMAFRQEVEDIFDGLDSMGDTHLLVVAPDEAMPIRLEGVQVARGRLERRGMRPGSYRIEVGDDGVVWNDEVELVPGKLVEVRPEGSAEPTGANRQAPVADATESADAGDSDVGDEDRQDSMAIAESSVIPGDETSLRRPDMDYDRRHSNMGAYSLMTVGVTSLAMSGVMVFLMRGVEDQIRDENAAGTMDSNRYRELTRRGESYQMAQYVLLVVGSAAVASGAGWAIWNHSRQPDASAASERQIWLGATPTGVALSGRW